MSEKGSLLTQAIKAVKGENTQQLIENFTSEMTLVAEGLFEDQANLNRRIEELYKEEDGRLQKTDSRIESVDRQREEDRNDLERQISELKTRITELEKKERSAEKKRNEKRSGDKSLMDKIITLAIIVCVTAVITVLLTKLL